MDNKKEFSPQESLELIQSMIDKTKGHVANNSFYFLLWGWLVFICSIAEYLLKVVFQETHHYWVWWLMPLGFVFSIGYGIRNSKKVKVRTFVEDALDYLWIGLALAFITMIFINTGYPNSWQIPFTYYILLYAIGTFVSGKLMQFRPLVIGGGFNFILSAISVRFNFDYQLLIGALAILTSYIIPGHLLRVRFQKKNP